MKAEKFRKVMAGLLGIGMAAAVAFSGTTPVLAADDSGDTQEAVMRSFNKVYSVERGYESDNADPGSPAETFTFGTVASGASGGTATLTKVEDSSYASADDKSIPENIKTISIGQAAFEEGDAGKAEKNTKAVNVTFPAASTYGRPGKYTYAFSENAGNTAGVTYNSENYDVVVVVSYKNSTETENSEDLQIESVKLHRQSDDNKGKDITNIYKAGKLTVTKKVTGTMGDRNQPFTVHVTLTKPEDKTVKSTIHVTTTNTDENAKVQDIVPSDWGTNNSITKDYVVKNGTSFSLENIPEGVSYKVQEDSESAKNYTVSYTKNNNNYSSDVEEKVTGKTNDTISIVNDRNGSGDTGIFMNNLPYILVIAALAAGVAAYAVVMTKKKRA